MHSVHARLDNKTYRIQVYNIFCQLLPHKTKCQTVFRPMRFDMCTGLDSGNPPLFPIKSALPFKSRLKTPYFLFTNYVFVPVFGAVLTFAFSDFSYLLLVNLTSAPPAPPPRHVCVLLVWPNPLSCSLEELRSRKERRRKGEMVWCVCSQTAFASPP